MSKRYIDFILIKSFGLRYAHSQANRSNMLLYVWFITVIIAFKLKLQLDTLTVAEVSFFCFEFQVLMCSNSECIVIQICYSKRKKLTKQKHKKIADIHNLFFCALYQYLIRRILYFSLWMIIDNNTLYFVGVLLLLVSELFTFTCTCLLVSIWFRTYFIQTALEHIKCISI